MKPDYLALAQRGIDTSKVAQVWELYNQVLKDVQWHIDDINNIDPESLEDDIYNFQRIKDILLI